MSIGLALLVSADPVATKQLSHSLQEFSISSRFHCHSHTHPHRQRTESCNRSFIMTVLHRAQDLIHIAFSPNTAT
jgi:hypothetical protein